MVIVNGNYSKGLKEISLYEFLIESTTIEKCYELHKEAIRVLALAIQDER